MTLESRLAALVARIGTEFASYVKKNANITWTNGAGMYAATNDLKTGFASNAGPGLEFYKAAHPTRPGEFVLLFGGGVDAGAVTFIHSDDTEDFPQKFRVNQDGPSARWNRIQEVLNPVNDGDAVNLATLEAQIAAIPTGGVPGTWVDCSAMTTAAAINAAAATAGAGATIWLGARPPSAPLLVTETLIYQERQRWLGAGGRSGLTVIKAAAGLASGLPIMAATGWYNNAGDADEAVHIEGIKFDLDSLTGRHGLIVYNFWSTFRDLHFTGAAGATAKCLLITDKARNGTTISSNSHSENTFEQLRFDATTAGAGHFYQESNNTNSNQDGHLVDSFFAGANGACIELRRAAGWTVENNHLYGCGDDAIIALLCYGTKISGNYIEDFGRNGVNTSPTNGYYTAIGMSILSGKPSLCSGNTISFVTPTGNTYVRLAGISARAGSAQLRARVNIENNIIAMSGAAETITNSEAIRIGEAGDTGRLLEFALSGNTIANRNEFTTQIFRSNSTTRMVKDAPGVRSYTAVTGTHVLDNQHEMVQNFTVTGAVEIDPPATNVYARDGEPMQLRFFASGGARAITFDATIRTSTGLTRGPYNVPQNEMLLAAVEWNSLLADYVLTAATISAN